MQASARSTLVSLTEEHLKGIVRDAVAVQRHCKRARWHEDSSSSAMNLPPSSVRRRLHAMDVNLALQMRGCESLYATPVVPSAEHDNDQIANGEEEDQNIISLQEFFLQESIPVPPSEVGIRTEWIAVDGVQPEQYLQQQNNKSEIPSKTAVNGVSSATGSLLVQQLQTTMLSEELQLYFTRVTTAIERGSAKASRHPITSVLEQQDTVIRSMTQDTGIQELVPFFVKYAQQQFYKHAEIGDIDHCRTLIRLWKAMLHNPHLHLELQLQEILPTLITCIVAQQLSKTNEHNSSSGSGASSLNKTNHWALRRDAAAVLVYICRKFGSQYTTLKSRILPKLLQAVVKGQHQAVSPAELASCYGGIVAISLFGCKAIDSFLLPVLVARQKARAKLVDEGSLEESMCQQAALAALGTFLYYLGDQEKADRISWENELFEHFGEALLPISGHADEYNMCFI